MDRVPAASERFHVGLLGYLRDRSRILWVTGVVLLVLLVVHGRRSGIEATPEASLRAALSTQGLELSPGDFLYLPRDGGVGRREVLFLARPSADVTTSQASDGPRDLYAAQAWVAGGAVLDLLHVGNLTRSPSADEASLMRVGEFAVYQARVRGNLDAVTALDLRGEPATLTAGWPLRATLQNRVSNFLNTGRLKGFGRCRFSLAEPIPEARLELREPSSAMLFTPRETVSLRLEACATAEQTTLAVARPTVKGMPGTITWVVDTVRGLSFVGPEPIEWLEHRVFSLQDQIARWTARFQETSVAEQEQRVRDELGMTANAARRRFELAHADPEQDFPPEPMRALFSSALAGEGEWNPVADDPFAKSYPNAPVPFYTSYLRPDRERAYARVYIALWDPRLVQLRMMAGTREPEGATGDTGPGEFPRDPTTLQRVVAGFNGGFQALHGEFGMMVDNTIYLPPKPWAATVAVFQDGRVAMGSWTDPPEGTRQYREAWALGQVPDDMVDMRQNLTSVVEGERYNPWGRWWWGAAPLNADQQLHIDRSGLCLTEEGHMAYFWGRSLGPEALGEAMLRARCVRGMHLDMNVRHTGFEFLDARLEGTHPPLPADSLGRGRFDGPMPHAPGYRLRARLLARSMKPMRFPRYASRDPRDFFYLLLKPVLPGPDLASGDEAQRSYSTAGLPHAGFPRPFARVFRGPDPERGTWLVRIDLERLALEQSVPPEPSAQETANRARPLAYLTGVRRIQAPEECGYGLFRRPQTVGARSVVGEAAAADEWVLCGDALPAESTASAAIGVDSEGFVVYAERLGDDPLSIDRRLQEAGVTHALVLPDDARLAFLADEAYVGPGAFERTVNASASLPLWPKHAAASSVLFPDTEPRPYSRWARMQDTRVRYIRDGAPTFSRSSGGLRDEPDDSSE